LYVVDQAHNVSAGSTAILTVDNTAPTTQNTVFGTNTSAIGATSLTIGSSGVASDEIWFAPSATTISVYTDLTALTAGNFSKITDGTAGSITTPANEANYKLYVVDLAHNVSAGSTAILTVDNTAPNAFNIT